jgi:6,7-dimethyl-8-ribityllumazine synthase
VSREGSPDIEVSASGLRVAIVAASWHERIMAGLVSSATRVCADAGADAEVIHVAGSFELPVVTQAALTSGGFDAAVALGVVIRGGTPHFEYVCAGTTSGLMDVALRTGRPVGFGLLTCDDEAQALDRAGFPDSSEDKGAEAAWAAILTAVTLRELASGSTGDRG